MSKDELVAFLQQLDIDDLVNSLPDDFANDLYFALDSRFLKRNSE